MKRKTALLLLVAASLLVLTGCDIDDDPGTTNLFQELKEDKVESQWDFEGACKETCPEREMTFYSYRYLAEGASICFCKTKDGEIVPGW